MLELNKIYCMDCLEGLKLIPDNSIDLAFADPPYGIDGAGFEIPEKNYKRIDAEWDKVEPDYIWIDEAIRTMKDGSAIYITGTHHNIFNIKNYLDTKEEMIFKNFITWYKPNSMPINLANQMGVWAYSCEYILYYSKGRPKNFQYDALKELNNGVQQRDFIQCYKREETIDHPSPKPLRILRKILTASSKKGDTVLDPFMGSGTTAVACKQLQRNFIGFELSQKYVDIANRRLQQDTLFDYVLEGALCQE